MDIFSIILVPSIVITIYLLYTVFFKANEPKPDPKQPHKEEKPKKPKKVLEKVKSPDHLAPAPHHKDKKKRNHESILINLHGFSKSIEDFKIVSHYALFSEADHTIKIFDLKKLDEKPHHHRFDFDWASCFDVDDKGRIVCGMKASKLFITLEKYPKPVEDKKTGKISYFEEVNHFGKNMHPQGISSVYLTSKNDCVVSCGLEEDTFIHVFHHPKGTHLFSFNTNQIKHYHLSISPSKTFIGANTWSPELKMLEVHRNKEGEFVSLTKAYVFTGHRKRVLSISYDQSEKIALSVSEDGTARLWNVNIRYQVSEDPHILKVFEGKDLGLEGEMESGAIWSTGEHEYLIALSIGKEIAIFDQDKNVKKTLKGVYETKVRTMKFMELNEKLILVALAENDDRLTFFAV